MRNYTAILISGFLLLCSSTFRLQAQIVDDTTKSLYSGKTTRMVYEKDIMEGRYEPSALDTLLENMHRSRHWYHDTAFYQELENIGRAARKLDVPWPERIGSRLGKNVYDRYAYKPGSVPYYDTRSPYSHLYYVQGSLGEQVFEVKYTRNIKKWVNLGIAYNLISANKQIGGDARAGQVDHHNVVLFGHYQTKNDKYHLFANYTHLNHREIETGGVKPGQFDGATTPVVHDTTQNNFFGYLNEDINLRQAANRDIRNDFHLTQVYRLAKENLKVFHTFDRRRQYNRYNDNTLQYIDVNQDQQPDSLIFYPNALPYFSPDSTLDKSTYHEFENVAGLKGNTRYFEYTVYAKRRDASIFYLNKMLQAGEDSHRDISLRRNYYNQNFIGGNIRLLYKDLVHLAGNAEYKFADEYIIQASARLKFLTYTQSRTSYKPTITQQLMQSNHFNWDNNFENTVSDRTALALQIKLPLTFLKAEGSYTNHQNFVYYDEEVVPRQLSTAQRLYQLKVHHHFNFKGIHLDNIGQYTNTNQAEFIRLPELIVQSKLYLQGHVFKNALFGQIGLDGYWQSTYFADAYMPAIQQFYRQNTFNVKSYPVLDVFLAADIKTVNVFLKMSHVNYQLGTPSSYFLTPFYPGMRRSFVFGLKWMFYD